MGDWSTQEHRGPETDLTHDLKPSLPLLRRPQHSNKAPQVTYLSGVLEADLRAPPTQPTRLRPQHRASRQAAPNQMGLEC